MIVDEERDRRLMKRAGALVRHWRRVFLGAAVCSAAALLVSLVLPKIYRATTYILITESKIGAGSREQVWQQTMLLPTFVPFVDNDVLISQSLKKFGLDRPPYNLTVDRFRRKDYLEVELPKSTRLLELQVEFPDAKLATDLANDLAQRAVEFNSRMNAADTLATREFLKTQLDEATARLSQAAANRLRVRKEAGIEDREKQLSVLLGEKEFLASQLDQLRLSLAQQESKSKLLVQALAGQPRTYLLKKSVAADPLLGRVAEKANPDALALSMTEESLNTTREEIQRILVNADASSAAERAGIHTAEERLELVNREVSQLLPEVTTWRGRLDEADHDYELACETVKAATREYQDASVTVSSKSQDLKQVAPALIPERPVRPRILLNTILGFLLGGALSAGIALAAENFEELRTSRPYRLEEDEQVPLRRV